MFSVYMGLEVKGLGFRGLVFRCPGRENLLCAELLEMNANCCSHTYIYIYL